MGLLGSSPPGFGLLGWSVVYVVGHLLLYVLVLRRRDAFRSERVIFRYHVLSALLLTAVALTGLAATVAGWLAPGSGVNLDTAVAVVALHGTYSLSFLEVWSLAEGGYSLQILEHVRSAEQAGRPLDVAALRAIGSAKQASRLDGLGRLGLVRQHGEQIELTGVGRVIAAVLASIAWLTNVQDGV